VRRGRRRENTMETAITDPHRDTSGFGGHTVRVGPSRESQSKASAAVAPDHFSAGLSRS